MVTISIKLVKTTWDKVAGTNLSGGLLTTEPILDTTSKSGQISHNYRSLYILCNLNSS